MPEQEVVLKTDKLCKRFKNVVAVNSFDLQLQQGDIFGLMGLNGSGKTTLIKMLATLLKPTSGTAYIFGYDIFRKPDKIRGFIGYMSDSLGLYNDLKVSEYLNFFAEAYKIPKNVRKSVIQGVIELTDLETKKDLLIGKLSTGIKQRLCLAKTLLHDPQILLLDEPAAGLDPVARNEIKEVFKELASMGKTILVTSNILSEIGDYCNRIGIIDNGKLLFDGNMNELLSSHESVMSLEDGFLRFVRK